MWKKCVLHQTKFMALLALASDPAASMSVSNLKQALMEIHDVVVALQNTATTTSQFLEEKGMYSDDEVPDPFYSGHSDEDSADDCRQDVDDDYDHYVRSP